VIIEHVCAEQGCHKIFIGHTRQKYCKNCIRLRTNASQCRSRARIREAACELDARIDMMISERKEAIIPSDTLADAQSRQAVEVSKVPRGSRVYKGAK